MNNKLGERNKGKGKNYELRITNYEFEGIRQFNL